MWPTVIIAVLFGLLAGSFLNVVVYRFGTGKSIVRGRSQCFSCARVLRWYELIPVVSYLVQRGRCRGCFSHIAYQYPLVELLTGLLFGALAWSGAVLGLYLTTATLVAILVYDLRHMIIPDPLVYAFIILAILNHAPDWWMGPVLFAVFGSLWLVSRGKWMGFGDAKLVLGIGLLLGFSKGLSAMLIAFWSGALVGVALLYWKRRLFTMKSEIPFAPFLILGAFLALILNIQVF